MNLKVYADGGGVEFAHMSPTVKFQSQGENVITYF